MKFRFGSCALVMLALATPALAQKFYLPVQYQFGRFGEVYYGGRAGIYPYTPAQYAQVARFGFASPAYHSTRFDDREARTPDPILFTDLYPGEEVGYLGFTPNDARNEAYFNVPLYQAAADSKPPAPPTEAAPPLQPSAAQAVPLLNWVRTEVAKGPAANRPLIAALVHEAAKYDPMATARTCATLGIAP